MGKLYLFSNGMLVFCIIIITITVIIQTVGITYGFQRFLFKQKFMLENVIEIVVLIQILTLAAMTAEVMYHIICGFVYPGGHIILRYMLFVLLAGMSLCISWQKRLFWPLGIILAASMTLPATEKIAGNAFPMLFILALIFWILRSMHLLLLHSRQYKNQLSVLSIKEAVDSLDSGILFYQADGQILLQNRRMQKLMFALTGKFQYNGRVFLEALEQGKILPSCKKGGMGTQTAYWLPDGSIWVFELHVLHENQIKGLLLIASNTTERWKAMQQLWEQNQELERRNQELKLVLENLETICKTEETIHAKSRVHDVLGQKISLLLRAIREHREPDEVLLNSFAKGLTKDLTGEVGNAYSLDTLVEAFRGLGVTIHVEGALPQKELLARTFSEIVAEAVTNSVRHGYAAEIYVTIDIKETMWQMDITDSGIPNLAPVVEGGGLHEMRRKTEALGGVFSYETKPHFHIQVKLPEGETV